MTDEPVTVPVIYIGNDDVARHIKAPKAKKTSRWCYYKE